MKQKKHLRNIFLISAVMFFLLGCGNQKEDAYLKQAFELHTAAVKVRKSAGDKLDKLIQSADSTFQVSNADKLDSIKQLLKAWDEQLVEVPGFEEEHDHSGHDHAHDHSHDHKTPNLTSEQHLEVQQHLFDEIQSLANQVNSLEY